MKSRSFLKNALDTGSQGSKNAPIYKDSPTTCRVREADILSADRWWGREREMKYFFGFLLLLQSCGGSQGFDASNPPSSSTANPNAFHPSASSSPNTSAAKSNDADLEKFVGQIHSNDYDNNIIVEIDDAPGVVIQENRLRLSGGRGTVGANTLNLVLDRARGTLGLTALFNSNLALL